jgi:hypothetical protein
MASWPLYWFQSSVDRIRLLGGDEFMIFRQPNTEITSKKKAQTEVHLIIEAHVE